MDNKLSLSLSLYTYWKLMQNSSNRLWALARIRKFLSFEQAKRLSKAYIISTFKYCPLKAANNLINKIHKPSLSVAFEMTMQISKIQK